MIFDRDIPLLYRSLGRYLPLVYKLTVRWRCWCSILNFVVIAQQSNFCWECTTILVIFDRNITSISWSYKWVLELYLPLVYKFTVRWRWWYSMLSFVVIAQYCFYCWKNFFFIYKTRVEIFLNRGLVPEKQFQSYFNQCGQNWNSNWNWTLNNTDLGLSIQQSKKCETIAMRLWWWSWSSSKSWEIFIEIDWRLETSNFHKNFTTLKSVTPRSWREMTPQHFFYQKMSSKKNHWCFRHPRISLESLPKSLLINVHARHIVRKLLKMSHLNYWILAFSTNFDQRSVSSIFQNVSSIFQNVSSIFQHVSSIFQNVSSIFLNVSSIFQMYLVFFLWIVHVRLFCTLE